MYERNLPFQRPFSNEVKPPPRVIVRNLDGVTYFGCPGVLVLMLWNPVWGPTPADWREPHEVRFNLEQFLEQYHAVDNVVALKR